MQIIAQITLNTVRLFLLAPKISSHKKEIVTSENIFWLFCVESIWILVKLKKIKRKMAELIKSNPMESPLMIKSLMENVGKNKKAILMITKLRSHFASKNTLVPLILRFVKIGNIYLMCYAINYLDFALGLANHKCTFALYYWLFQSWCYRNNLYTSP